MQNLMKIRSLFVVASLLTLWLFPASAQVWFSRLVRPVDETQVVTLDGNVHPLARAEFDQGVVSAATRMDRMLLVLKPTAAQQKSLDALVAAQQNPASPLYHQWLTPSAFGVRFGASAQSRARVVAWLMAHGFTVQDIPAGNRLIVFSGTAGQVFDAFHTEMHRYRVDGVTHIANSQDPQIPSPLSGVVGGMVSLHDFRRRSEIRTRMAIPLYSAGSTHYLFPADFAAIYDLNPLRTAGTNGSGVSIAIAGRSDIKLSDVASFRSLSGLAANTPSVVLAGTDPGLGTDDQDESTLDVEWAGAVAPQASVSLVTAASTGSTDGIDLAAQYIVNHDTAPVVSVSYGSCEQEMGSTELTFYRSLWEQAASQGISVFVASGDAGAAGCSAASASQGSQAAVNGLCSSPYATCVGGTEFNEGANSATYWSAANSSSYGSALSYIPEKVWNESASNGGSGLWASGGGVSTVYAQPDWQAAVSGAGVANGMRAVPDLAFSAANHDGYMIYENNSLWIVSGTSAASPVFADMMALVVQSQGGTGQGSANPELYSLVNASRNPFHATPSGSNSVPGVAGFTASGATYNLATGLGSVDAAALVASWGSVSSGVDFVLTASAGSATVQAGSSAVFTISVTESGSAQKAVTLSASMPTGVSVSFSSSTVLPGAPATVTVAVGSAAASRSVAMSAGSFSTVSLTATTGGSFSGGIAFSVIRRVGPVVCQSHRGGFQRQHKCRNTISGGFSPCRSRGFHHLRHGFGRWAHFIPKRHASDAEQSGLLLRIAHGVRPMRLTHARAPPHPPHTNAEIAVSEARSPSSSGKQCKGFFHTGWNFGGRAALRMADLQHCRWWSLQSLQRFHCGRPVDRAVTRP
jgi:subtilase family serine protease